MPEFPSDDNCELNGLEYRQEEPVTDTFETEGFSLDQLGRLSSRGIVLNFCDRLPGVDDKKTAMSLTLIQGTPAYKMSQDAMADPAGGADLLMDYFQEALSEEDDDRFKARWIQYF